MFRRMFRGSTRQQQPQQPQQPPPQQQLLQRPQLTPQQLQQLEQQNRAVCNAALRDQVQGERRLAEKAAACLPGSGNSGNCSVAKARLAGQQAALRGARAKCMQETGLKRRREQLEAKSQRSVLKTQIFEQKEQRQQQAFQGNLQRRQQQQEMAMQQRQQQMEMEMQRKQQKQEIARSRLETAIQRQQYKMQKVNLRKARIDAGLRMSPGTVLTGGAIAAAAAAFIFL